MRAVPSKGSPCKTESRTEGKPLGLDLRPWAPKADVSSLSFGLLLESGRSLREKKPPGSLLGPETGAEGGSFPTRYSPPPASEPVR